MSELFFVFKALIITVVLVVLLQIRVENTSIEERAMNWFQTSPILQPLQETADGAIKVIKKSWKKTLGSMNSKFFREVREDRIPGKRDLSFRFERSQQYVKEQAEKAEQSLRNLKDEVEAETSTAD